MKTPIVICLFASVVSLAAAQVAAPAAREEFLARAELLRPTTLDEARARFPEPINPFFGPPPPSPSVTEAEAAAGQTAAAAPAAPPPVTIDDLTADLRPSGIMELSGIPFLMFGESRLREGDTLTVRYRGNNYDLQVVRLETRRYVLRWNDQTVTKTLQN